MKTNTLINSSLPHFALIFIAFTFSGCYTVLKQSGEYYSEFGQDTSNKPQETNTDLPQSDSIVTEEEGEAVDSGENTGNVIINRYYYDSPWWAGYGYGYPGHYWSVSLGYTWYPLGYYPYDYYYGGGCYYPSYPGYYPYYPDPWYNPGTSYPSYSSRRNYGMRHDAFNSPRSGLNRTHSISSATVISQRQYNSGTTAKSNSTSIAQNKKAVKETKKNRRSFRAKSDNTASTPVEKRIKSKGEQSGQRTYKEVDVPKKNKSFQQGFENAKSHFARNDNQSSNSSNARSSSGGSNSSRSSGGRSASPNVGSRSYRSKK